MTEALGSGMAALRELRTAQGERIRQTRKREGLTIEVAARLTGLHSNTIGRIERGESEATLPQLYLLAQAFKVDPSTLSPFPPSHDAAPGWSEPQPSTTAVTLGRFVYVPHFDVGASAGIGNPFSQVENVKTMRPFDQSYIRGELGLGHEHLALISVIGDSMEPRLSSGDTVLVDLRSGQEMVNDGIHVIRLDEALLVKQVQRLPGRVYRIRSLNSDYEPFEVRPSEETERDFAIIGRVRWGGVTIK